jgi:hypothetical protein
MFSFRFEQLLILNERMEFNFSLPISKTINCLIKKRFKAETRKKTSYNSARVVQGSKTNLLSFSDVVSDAIDNKHQVDAVYTDFAKALLKLWDLWETR